MLSNNKHPGFSLVNFRAIAQVAASLTAVCLVLTGCSFSSADKSRKLNSVNPSTTAISSGGERLTDLQRRVTDARISTDWKTMDELQSRIAVLNDNGRPLNEYFICKAQAWLDFGRDEYTENDRSGVANAALRESLILIQAMERGETPSRDTQLVETTVMLREDMWQQIASLKTADGDCADCSIAKWEVMMVWAGHEQPELGWRHAEPYIRHAEELGRQAQKEADSCNLEPKAAPASCPVMCAEKAAEQVPGNIHFALDRSTIGPVSAMILNRLADIMISRPAMQVTLTGHTDPTSNSAYNDALSERRAQSTLKYLKNRGVPARQLATAAAGENQLAVTGCSPRAHSINRRVEVGIIGANDLRKVDQLDDLQPTPEQTYCTTRR